MRKDIVLWKPGRKLTQNSRRRGIKRKRRIRILLKAKLDWTATFSCNARAFVESSFQDPTSRSRVSPLRRIPSGDPVHMKIPSGHPVTIYEQKHGRSGDPVRLEMPSGDPVACHAHQYGLSGDPVGLKLLSGHPVALGYSYTFLLMMVLQVIAFFYILLLAKDPEIASSEADDDRRGLISRVVRESTAAFADYWQLLTTERRFSFLLGLNLFALAVELLIFAGLMDIQYSYLRYKLGWGDKQYGWFSGLQYGVTTATVLIVYPFLYIRGFTDGLLGCLGLTAKTIALLMLAFVSNSAMAYSVIVFTSLNRFVSTSFRSFISSLIQNNEQGKMFSLIALLEGATGLLATAIYNNLYPKTLSFFPGFFYLLSAALLVLPLIILG
ncbi:hypothetical protein Y032_0128g1426 [Ancylostoma ceylanicum]|uniref:Major facilitator superfamily associated domain-containing protein n=1 Tax=Ancylostoma ceylanicum TaxID=53326 RepID=A0A016T7X8_9BILA|nr:hypothetical protein Y032_0128g1426 [Ancylostoma ceylanicum]